MPLDGLKSRARWLPGMPQANPDIGQSLRIAGVTDHASGPVLRTRGFSLVEMLLVVAMIALLISILLPSLSRARENTRRASCAVNQRQLANGVLSYTASNRGFLIGEGVYRREGQDPNYYNNLEWRSMWMGWIGGYTIEDAADIFYCPSMARVTPATAWPVPMPWGGEYMLGYPYFGHYLNEDNGKAYNWAGTLPSARRISAKPRTPIFADWNRGDLLNKRWGMVAHSPTGGQGPFADTYGGSVPHFSAPPWSPYAAIESPSIAPEGANNALLDGSVQWFGRETFEVGVASAFLWAKTE